MNKLSTLAAQIRDEPNQDGFRQSKTQFKTIADKAEVVLKDLQEVGQQLLALEEIIEDDSIRVASSQNLNNIHKSAVTIAKLINATTPASNQIISPQINSLTENILAISNQATSYWTNASSSEVELSETFIELTSYYDPEAKKRIQETLAKFINVISSIPTSRNEINLYKSAKVALKDAMTGLNLDGPASSFLLSAMNGSGNPKDLLNKEVVEFLNQHPTLWKSLKVGFN